jgi:hypothetical protein
LLVKAVRKFELTPSQVSVISSLTFHIPSIPHADPDLTRGFISTRRLGWGEAPERPIQEKAARNRGIFDCLPLPFSLAFRNIWLTDELVARQYFERQVD